MVSISLKVVLFFAFIHQLVALQNIISIYPTVYRSDETAFSISTDKCTNVPPEFGNPVKAVHTWGNSVGFYSGLNCSEASIELLPSSPYLQDLRLWNFVGQTNSVGPYRYFCNYVDEPPSPISAEQFGIVFKYTENTGYVYPAFHTEGCMYMENLLANNAQFLKGSSKCFELYDNPNCKKELVQKFIPFEFCMRTNFLLQLTLMK